MILKHVKEKQDEKIQLELSKEDVRCKKISKNEMMHKEKSHEGFQRYKKQKWYTRGE